MFRAPSSFLDTLHIIVGLSIVLQLEQVMAVEHIDRAGQLPPDTFKWREKAIPRSL